MFLSSRTRSKPMKTIATKLDNKDHEKFLEICNESGCSKSEKLRKIIRDFINTNEEPDESFIELVQKESQQKTKLEPRVTFI